MYHAYFGLAEQPFSLAPDPRYLYLSEVHREALAHLLYGIGEGGSFVQLTGEVGTGKTTTCRALLEQLPSDVDVAMIINPRLTSVELLAAVCDELHVAYPIGTTSPKVLIDALSQWLLDAHARGRRTALIIDEAQNLTAPALEEIRLLTNLETTREKLLQVVLVGPPELEALLARRSLRQLSQRVTARYRLRSLNEEESHRYVTHRMEIAGQHQPIFAKLAVRAAHRLSRGVPRVLNMICDRALLGAYATGQTQVTEAVVRRAANEVLGAQRGARWRIAPAIAVLVVVAGTTMAFVASSGLRTLGARPLSRADTMTSRVVDPPVQAATRAEHRWTEPTLAAILDDPQVSAKRATAFVNLYALWGIDTQSVNLDHQSANADRGCQLGQVAGLRCLVRTGTWTVLRRLNLPAVLELTTPAGRKHHVVLTRLDGERATLEIGSRRVTLPTVEVERFWDGSFVTIWKSPVTGPLPLLPGSRRRDVAWLRQRLGAPDKQPLAATANQIYDDELKRKVAAFQQVEALRSDGIAGEETLVRLVATAPGANVPSLNGERQ